MNRGLVAVSDTDRHRELLRSAGEFAAGADAELILFSTLSYDEYEDGKDAMKGFEQIEGTDYGIDTFRNQLEQRIESLANQVLDDLDVEYRIVPRIVDDRSEADEILDAAEETESDHIFIVGQKRSPTGKALFGDVAQSVILGFDGRVTVDLE
ncbi:universal stress protein UspA-like protein [Halovivax ruber XH-70]|uniref:Universal stress protein UspA-like protein n=1 Tax=Halovivax ruber (strain DSM 18193 / JCM 13892 / XH-70) TaxID=797302 RepID=L0I6Z7_HALRX|nr:universal stress protein [Halovivax ruber]AGB15305.1 universal stress protein UspA-like protein [Halovivax ruber XH-70]